MKQLNIDNNQFITKINQLFDSEDEFRVSMIGWQDGDYFKELCEEDGGLISEHYQIFQDLPLGKKVNREGLNKIINRYQKVPFLTSKNGNYQFNYDLHIWSKKLYLIYNSYLHRLIVKKLNLLDKLFSPTVQPSWQG